jgi:4-amino-4-deoxy-L-arabinose transferase-like glycosyltransferase
VAVGIAARLVFALGYWVDKPFTHDEREYVLLARNLAAGRGFVYLLADGSPAPGEHFGRAPVYPLFLAAVIRTAAPAWDAHASDPAAPAVPDRIVAIVKAMQALLGGVTIWLLAWLAGRIAGPRAGLAAAVLAALYPPLVWLPAYLFSETLYLVLALGCVLLLSARGTGARVWVAAGVVAGLAVLTRPAMLFVLLVAVPWVCGTRGWRAALLVTLASAVVVAPWSARNTRAYGRLVLVASEGGVTFWTGNHALAGGEGDLAANPDLKRANIEFRTRHAGLTPEQLEPLYYREALAWMRSEPAAWLGLLARKAWFTVAPCGPSYRLHSPLYFGTSAVSYLLMLPAAIAGWVALRRDRWRAAPLVWLAAGSVVMSLVFFPQERFRITGIDPALLVFAAAWWARRNPTIV